MLKVMILCIKMLIIFWCTHLDVSSEVSSEKGVGRYNVSGKEAGEEYRLKKDGKKRASTSADPYAKKKTKPK
jgi:hypothetical protein